MLVFVFCLCITQTVRREGPALRTSSGNSSPTRDMMREVFPTPAVEDSNKVRGQRSWERHQTLVVFSDAHNDDVVCAVRTYSVWRHAVISQSTRDVTTFQGIMMSFVLCNSALRHFIMWSAGGGAVFGYTHTHTHTPSDKSWSQTETWGRLLLRRTCYSNRRCHTRALNESTRTQTHSTQRQREFMVFNKYNLPTVKKWDLRAL